MILPPGGRTGGEGSRHKRRGECAAIETNVDVAIAGDFHRGHAGNLSDRFDQLFGDLLRRLLQGLRELEGNRHGDLAERSLPRLFEAEIGFETEALTELLAECRVDSFFDAIEHGNLSIAGPYYGF